MAHTENLDLNVSRTFGEKLGDTFAFARINAAVLLQVHLFVSLPIVIAIAGILFLLFPDYFSLLGTIDSGVFIDTVSRRREDWAWFIQNIGFPSLAILPVSANSFILVDMYEKGQGEKLRFQDVLREIPKKLPKLLFAKLIMLPLILFVTMLTLVPELIGVKIVVAIMLAPLCLIMYTLFSFVEMLILQHDYKLQRALSYSSKIAGKYFWTVYGTNLVILLIFIFLTFAMEFPALALDTLEGLTIFDLDMNGFWGILSAALRAFSGVGGFILFTFVSINAGVLYFSLKEKNNRSGILERIKRIGIAEKPENIYLEDEQY